MKVVLDTSVIVAGLRSRDGASFKILAHIPRGKIKFILSVALFLEYEAVIKRKAFLNATRLRLKDVNAVLDMLAAKCIQTKVYYLWRPQLKDPNDDLVLETAVSGSADAIVTFNTKDFVKVEKKFDVNILLPSEYLTKLRRSRQ